MAHASIAQRRVVAPPPWRWLLPRRPRRLAPAASRADAPAAPPDAEGDDVPRGCAWYVSSQELALGVDVCERDATDADLWPLLSWELRYREEPGRV